MISELSDEEIMNFLMTSDFEDNYSTKELKYLLVKWRYFYRLLYGRFDLKKTDSDFEISKLDDRIKMLNNKIEELQIKVADSENVINSMKNRKLTWRERISGRIIEEKKNTEIENA